MKKEMPPFPGELKRGIHGRIDLDYQRPGPNVGLGRLLCSRVRDTRHSYDYNVGFM